LKLPTNLISGSSSMSNRSRTRACTSWTRS
jgi:hypothetical protein